MCTHTHTHTHTNTHTYICEKACALECETASTRMREKAIHHPRRERLKEKHEIGSNKTNKKRKKPVSETEGSSFVSALWGVWGRLACEPIQIEIKQRERLREVARTQRRTAKQILGDEMGDPRAEISHQIL